MLNIIIGEKGTGKTKKLIDSIHQAEATTNGSVVFINKGDRHIFDVSHKVRLVNTAEFNVDTYASLYGMVCGMISQNYDIKHIFVDSVTKIAGDDLAMLEKFLDEVNVISEKMECEVVIFISLAADKAPAGVMKYAK
ncbi:MAG: ATP-binding protein [Clostridia bacterium]